MPSRISLVVFSAVLLTIPSLLAQATSPADNPSVKPESTESQFQTVDKDLKPWVPESKARFARAFQYQLGLQEQPGTATIQNGSSVQFIPNPEHYLVKHSLTFQFSELFLTPSDFASALKAVSYVNSGKGLNLRNLCGVNTALACVASSGPWWQRAISGVTIVFSLSERTRVVSNIVVPAGPFPSDYDKAGEIDFNPAQIFNLGSNWKDAAAALKDVTLLTDGGDDKDPCFRKGKEKGYFPPDPEDCVTRYGGFKHGSERKSERKEVFVGLLAVALPTFKYLRQTQFDFLKNGGVLTPSPFPEPALNSYTFTWDLRRRIAPAKERAAVAEAMKTYNAPKKKEEGDGAKNDNPTQNGTKLCVTIANGQKSYMPISDSFPESSCQRFAETMSDGHFKFACVAMNCEVTFGDGGGHAPIGGNCAWAEGSNDLTRVAHGNTSP